jgi:hypothetical protein
LPGSFLSASSSFGMVSPDTRSLATITLGCVARIDTGAISRVGS